MKKKKPSETDLRHEAETNLTETQSFNQKILGMTPSIVYIFDLKTQQDVFVNRPLAGVLGYAADQTARIGSVFFPADVHPDDMKTLREKLEWIAAAKDGDIGSREYRVRDASGEWRWIGAREIIFSRGQDGAPNRIMGMAQDITERRRAEDLLKQSEAHYHLLADHMTDVIWLRDLDLNLLYISPSEEKIRGYTLAELQKTPFGELLTPDSVHIAMELFAAEIPKVLADPTYSPLVTREFEFYKRDGDLHTVESNMIVIRDESGKPTSILGQDRDITERKRMEEALRESEEKYREIIEQSHDGIFISDEHGNIAIWNKSMESITGIQQSETIGRSLYEIQLMLIPEEQITPELLEQLQSNIKNILESKTNWNGATWDQEIKRADGTRKVVQDTSFIIRARNTVKFGTIFHDITERKQMETALREGEERYRTVVSNTPLVTFVTNQKGIFTLSEGKGLAKLGLQPGQMVGLSIFDVYRDYPSIINAMNNALAGHNQRNEVEVQGIVFDVLFTPMFDEHGKVTKIIGVANDITERKQAEIELQHLKAGLELANIELKSALAREQQLSHTDALTGINNRRHLFNLAEHELEIAARYKQPLSVIMFDIDHFKKVNDTFGHAVGDQILELVTKTARAELRSADVIGRYGGEEFVIILPMTNAQQAYPLAERIRMGVAAIREPTEKGFAAVSLSIGIVELDHSLQFSSIEDLIRRADKAMYAAKQAGRNRTEIGRD